jgi:putative ABC transport system permease protein
MNVAEAFRLAWSGILVNKLRSFLTALGVIIGVGAVITLVAVGQGTSQQVTQRLSALGSNLIIVFGAPNKGARLTAADGANALGRVPYLTAEMPVVSGAVTAIWQDQNYSTTLNGVTPDYPQLRNASVADGSFFTSADVASRSLVVVLGPTVVQQLKIAGDPVGQTVAIDGYPARVVGVLASRGGSTGGENQDDVVLMPYTTAQRILGTAYVQQLYFQVDNGNDAALASAWLQAIFDHRFGRAQSVNVLSQDQLLSTVQQTTQTFTLLLAAVAGVSLLVGGIGIMNIMLVSVIERTREIGIRKAVGARRWHLLAQFLFESATLSCLGGVVGIAAGILGARAIARAGSYPAVVSTGSIVLAFAFAAAVGIIFGLWPAMQASRLDPIVALRHE